MRLLLAGLSMFLMVLVLGPVSGCKKESPKGGPGADKGKTTDKAKTDGTKTDGTKTDGVKTDGTKTDGTKTDGAKTDGTKATNGNENTFSLKVPKGNTNVTQGKKADITISINRGDDFNDDVKLTFKTPKGLTVMPETTTIKKGQDDARVTVEAAEDATVGAHQVTVTGTPSGGGKAVDINVGLDVKKKD